MVRSAFLWARAAMVVAFSLLLSNQGGTKTHAGHLFRKSIWSLQNYTQCTFQLWLPMTTLPTLLNYDFGL